MGDLVTGAVLALGWPLGALLEVADGRNLAGSVGAVGVAYYLWDTPLTAYLAASAVFGVSTYMMIKASALPGYYAKAASDYNKVEADYTKFKAASPKDQQFYTAAAAAYVAQNKIVATFVVALVASSNATVGA